MRKNLPYDKTVVTEFKVQIADLLTRSLVLKGSVAAPVMLNNAFNKGDATILANTPLQLPATKSVLIISSLEEFVLKMRGPDGEVSFTCKGLFVVNGASEAVTISVPTGVEQIRVQYIYS